MSEVKHEGILFREEIAIKALQTIINVIGGGGCCEGCDAEMRIAEDTAREALKQLEAGRA